MVDLPNSVSMVGPSVHVRWTSDSNPGPVFPMPGFGIKKFLILGSRRDYAVGRYFLANSTKVDEITTTQKRSKAPGPGNPIQRLLFTGVTS